MVTKQTRDYYRLSYVDSPDESMVVTRVAKYTRQTVDHAIMSNSSGPKEMVRNQVFAVFEQKPEIDTVSIVMANGAPFALFHCTDAEGKRHICDCTGRDVRITNTSPPGGQGRKT